MLNDTIRKSFGPAPTPDGDRETFAFERASATPIGMAHLPSTLQEIPPHEVEKPLSLSLRDLQTWFAEIVMNESSIDAALRDSVHGKQLNVTTERALLRVVTPGPRLSSLGRISIYHEAYRLRLIECLADDYPTLRHALGIEVFDDLCNHYITQYPSRSPNLNAYGRFMPEMSAHLAEDVREFAIDLARLEWALVEVLHAPSKTALSVAALEKIPVHEWSNARFVRSDSLRVLTFNYPVNRYLQALREDQDPNIPEREISATAIYRDGFRIWRMDLTRPMTGLLNDLLAGRKLGDALARIEIDESDPEALAQIEGSVMEWFRAWVTGGFFSSVSVDEPE